MSVLESRDDLLNTRQRMAALLHNEVEADDREIEVLKLAPSSIRIVDVEDLFQR